MNLLVGIDTEGDNQWDAAARAHQRFENIYALPRLHALFAQHGVRPTYVITYPVATDARSADVLRQLLAGGDCEIGAHHHAWETPPCTEEDIRRHPYASTLPRAQFEAQLASLTDAIADAVGTRPVSYRSGRFGFSADHVAGLERLGYLVESSVAPLFYESHKGGPEFVEAPLTPYFLAYDSATAPGTSELARGAGLGGAEPAAAEDRCSIAYARAPWPYTTKRMLRALRLLRMRWLRPSYSSLDDMIALARDLARGERAGAEPAVPFERGDRRRQPVQPDAGGARRASAIGWIGFSRSRRAISARCRRRSPNSAARTRADADPSRHAAPAARPGGQRAAAVAAGRLGAATAATRSSTWRIRRARAARAELAGPVTWVPRRSGGFFDRTLRLGSRRRRGAHPAALAPRDRARRSRPRPQQRAARRSWRSCSRAARTSRWCSRCTERRSGTTSRNDGRPDLFTRAYHGASYVTFYSDRLMARAHELGLGRRNARVVYPPVSERVRLARRRGAGGGTRRRSGSPIGTCC